MASSLKAWIAVVVFAGLTMASVPLITDANACSAPSPQIELSTTEIDDIPFDGAVRLEIAVTYSNHDPFETVSVQVFGPDGIEVPGSIGWASADGNAPHLFRDGCSQKPYDSTLYLAFWRADTPLMPGTEYRLRFHDGSYPAQSDSRFDLRFTAKRSALGAVPIPDIRFLSASLAVVRGGDKACCSYVTESNPCPVPSGFCYYQRDVVQPQMSVVVGGLGPEQAGQWILEIKGHGWVWERSPRPEEFWVRIPFQPSAAATNCATFRFVNPVTGDASESVEQCMNRADFDEPEVSDRLHWKSSCGTAPKAPKPDPVHIEHGVVWGCGGAPGSKTPVALLWELALMSAWVFSRRRILSSIQSLPSNPAPIQ